MKQVDLYAIVAICFILCVIAELILGIIWSIWFPLIHETMIRSTLAVFFLGCLFYFFMILER